MRAYRQRARKTQRQLAADLGLRAHSVVVNWERGKRLPDVKILERFALVLGLSTVEYDRLVRQVRAAADEPVNEVSEGQRGQNDALTTLIQFERAATRITDVSNALVPGLLQTVDYARMAFGDVPDVELKVSTRLGRRDVITRDRDPVQYTAYILESVLYQQIGQQVLVDQLRLIQRLADLPNVCIRIIPGTCGVTRAHMGSFVLLEFTTADPIVHVEQLSTSAFLRDRDDVEEHQKALASLDQVAMKPDKTVKFIANIIEKMEIT